MNAYGRPARRYPRRGSRPPIMPDIRQQLPSPVLDSLQPCAKVDRDPIVGRQIDGGRVAMSANGLDRKIPSFERCKCSSIVDLPRRSGETAVQGKHHEMRSSVGRGETAGRFGTKPETAVEG